LLLGFALTGIVGIYLAQTYNNQAGKPGHGRKNIQRPK
jgi:hypothetical protein